MTAEDIRSRIDAIAVRKADLQAENQALAAELVVLRRNLLAIAGPARCRGCGGPLPRRARQGNPRKWCAESCRLRSYRARGKPLRSAERMGG
jgi:hypothetical protein